MTISSLLPRRLAKSFMNVRLTCTSKRRVPKNGIFALSTYPSSMTSPVLISLTALSTVCGFMWLAEPRSSPAPHFDGQRWFSGGGVQLGACARTVLLAASIAPNTTPNAMRCMGFLPVCLWFPDVVRSLQNALKHRDLQAANRFRSRDHAHDWASALRATSSGLKKTLGVDVDVEPDLALAPGRGGEPFPQIGREIEATRRFHQQPEAMAAAHDGERRFGWSQHAHLIR